MAAKNGFIMVSNEVFTIIEVCGITDSLVVFLAIRKHGIHSFPSVKALCGLTKLSERQVRKMIGLLEQHGFIQVERPVDGKGTSRYTSLFEPGAYNAPLHDVHHPTAQDAPPGAVYAPPTGTQCTRPLHDVHPELEADNKIDLKTSREQQSNTKKWLPADAFPAFWQAYPKKVDKDRSHREWAKLAADPELTAMIMAAIETQKQGRQWKEGYIPNPSTWLHGRRWEDEVTLFTNGAAKNGSNLSYEEQAEEMDRLQGWGDYGNLAE